MPRVWQVTAQLLVRWHRTSVRPAACGLQPVRAQLSSLSPHQPCRAADRVPLCSQVLMTLAVAGAAGPAAFLVAA